MTVCVNVYVSVVQSPDPFYELDRLQLYCCTFCLYDIVYISACSEEFCVLPAMAVECQLENSNRSSSGESVADRGEVL